MRNVIHFAAQMHKWAQQCVTWCYILERAARQARAYICVCQHEYVTYPGKPSRTHTGHEHSNFSMNKTKLNSISMLVQSSWQRQQQNYQSHRAKSARSREREESKREIIIGVNFSRCVCNMLHFSKLSDECLLMFSTSHDWHQPTSSYMLAMPMLFYFKMRHSYLCWLLFISVHFTYDFIFLANEFQRAQVKLAEAGFFLCSVNSLVRIRLRLRIHCVHWHPYTLKDEDSEITILRHCWQTNNGWTRLFSCGSLWIVFRFSIRIISFAM